MDDDAFKTDVIGRLEALCSDVRSIGEQFETVGGRVETIGDRVETAAGRVATVGGHVETIGSQVEALGSHIARVEAVTGRYFEHVDRRLDAVVARLDEQDLFIERLMDKVDRLTTQVGLIAQASEQSLDALTRLTKRGTRLEHPDGDFPSGSA